MAKKTTKTFEVWDGSNWVELEKGRELYAEVVKAGLPVRVKYVTPKGVSTKVIANVENAPKDQQESVVAWLGASKDKELGAYFAAMVSST